MPRTLPLLLVLATGCATDGGFDEVYGGGKADGQGAFRAKLAIDQGYAIIEVLDDDLVHVEYGTGNGPAANRALDHSPMVGSTRYDGPAHAEVHGRRIETAELAIDVNEFGCAHIARLADGVHLTTVCPVDLRADWHGISLDPSGMQNVYGLGQYFVERGSADGDWIKHPRFRTDGDFGNHFRDFWGGADPQLQFPVMYAAGEGRDAYGLFLDNVYKQDWDFAGDSWWQVRMYGGPVRFYVMTGADLRDIRSDYMELSGRPPVPPRKVFGLWLSEFGFDSWAETDGKLADLRAAGFPMDGFMLDLQWFGGVRENSPDTAMGGLAWDRTAFADPEGKLRAYAADGIGIIPIEESYVGRNQRSYREMQQREGIAHTCDTDRATEFTSWFGSVGMIDWSSRPSTAWWHDNLRHPNLAKLGVLGHWTDLGEPERFDPNACYRGVEDGRYHHGDVHNLYNLLWHESIYDGYVRNHAEAPQRAFLLGRAGAPGMQRFGAGLWSGDIASRLDVLATHLNAAMHMSFAGIDYYGSDVGGFWRRAMPDDTNVTDASQKSVGELYTQWFANSAWFDVPLRPHTYNCGFANFPEGGCPHEVSPAKIGNVAANLANLRQRYELIPFYYSLAYRAFLAGEPVIAPLVMNYPDDPKVRQIGHEKMIGRDLLVGVVASHGQQSRTMYLPAGTWYDYHSGKAIRSTGQTTGSLSVRPGGQLRLPVFARAGAILPMMWVDDQTKDAYGHRGDGSTRDELVLKVFTGPAESSFELYEDDGATVAAFSGGRPTYRTRTTSIRQALAGDQLTVTIDRAQGDFPGAAAERDNELRIYTDGRTAGAVAIDGAPEARAASVEALRAAGGAGYAIAADGSIVVRTGKLAVRNLKRVVVQIP